VKYRYSKFIANLADEVDLEKLLGRLSDLLLSSGFDTPWDPQSDDDRAMQALHDAILDALLNGGALSDEMVDKLLSHDGTPESIQRQRDQIEQLVQQLIERLGEQGTSVPAAGRTHRSWTDLAARAKVRARRASKSQTRRSIFSAIARYATCSGPWDEALQAGTTRGNRTRASKRVAPPVNTSSATR